MKNICKVLFTLGVMPLGSAIALETQAVGDEIRRLHLDDSALNTPEGLSKIKNNQYLQNLLYSRVMTMDREDQDNWYQHSEFGKFILSQAGQHWIETYAGDEWLKQAPWFHWLQENAKNTWVFNNAAISWLNSPAALRWVDKHVGKNQFSKLMAYCTDKQIAQYKSDCEILKNTKAGKAFYNHSESRSSDHLFPSNTLQNPSTQSRGQTDNGFDNKGFNDGKPSFGQLDDNNYSEFKPSLLNSANLSILGGSVAAVAAIPAAVSVGIASRNIQTDVINHNDTELMTNQLRQCANIANGIECDLESEPDTGTLLRDLARLWDLRINGQPWVELVNHQLLEGIDRRYTLGNEMTSDDMSAALTLMYHQARQIRQNALNIPRPVINSAGMANIISLSHIDDEYGNVSEHTAINHIVDIADTLPINQTRLFPMLRDDHFYLIAIHRAEDRGYQVLVFDSAGINTQNSSLVRGVITRLQQSSQHVTALEYSRGVQAGNDCGFYVTYLMHRLINTGFSRVVHDLGLANNSQDNLFRLNPQSLQRRDTMSIWLRNYFTQLYRLVQNDNTPLSATAQSFLNHIARNNAFTDVSPLELLSYQNGNDPSRDNAIDHHSISENLLQSIGSVQGRNLSNGERRLILESHQGAVAPLTNPFLQSAFTRGIEVGLDQNNRKIVVNVILDKDDPNNSHIKLDLTMPVIAGETGSAVGDLAASTNIYFEQKSKKMTKKKQQGKSKNQGYQIPVRQKLIYKDITMRFEAKPDSRRV
ncbi:hypothetical protein [Cysteiniphilum halobium]|uniref:hypothetical protein n=1 Tax=Cysteiniphilum halobium TaxID=2219059 RepID=UPI000E64A54B|nr:hypothetical protein [Cysteiniphilum halobium]